MRKPGLIDTDGNWQGYMGDLKRSWMVGNADVLLLAKRGTSAREILTIWGTIAYVHAGNI
jgi:hypothetical protein